MLSVLDYGTFGDGFRRCWWVEIDGIWLILSLILGFVQWVSVGCGVGFWLVPVRVSFVVDQCGLRGGSWWVCGVGRDES